MGAVIQSVDSDTFEELVLVNSSDTPVLVNYCAAEQADCEQHDQLLANLAEQFQDDMALVKVDTSHQSKLAKNYGVTSLPTLKLFHKGVVIETLQGPQDERHLQSFIKRYLPRASDEILNKAFTLYQQGNIEEALSELDDAITDDPENIRLPITKARLLLSVGQTDIAAETLQSISEEQQADIEVKTLLGQIGFILEVGDNPDASAWRAAIEADTDDCESRYRLAAFNALNDDYPNALAGFFSILKINAEYRNAAAVDALQLIFAILGEQHELVLDYRAQMKKL